jgi:hypothetical protein
MPACSAHESLAHLLLFALGMKNDIEQTARIVIRNGSTIMARMYLEPWGGLYELAPGAEYEVRARGPAREQLTVEHIDFGVVVRGWPGCVLTVYAVDRNGLRQVADLARLPTPKLSIGLRLDPPPVPVSDDE